MLYLSIIYHNHQPYYKNLLTNETDVPWVRLHGTKDYLDMVEMLDKFPDIHLTFNMVPSLMEQIEDYQRGTVRDAFLDISRKKAAGLSEGERQFVTDHFFMINADKVIAMHPRYYELYFKAKAKKHFSCQDMLDLQVWFNLAWIDPLYRGKYAELKAIVNKGRFFTEADKTVVLDKQLEILKNILPGYAGFTKRGLIETIVSPYYHPILPLLYNTNLQMEARPSSVLPARPFSFPEDAQAQIFSAVDYFKSKFDFAPAGMWPSEESVCEHIVPMFIRSGIRWIVTDEAVLFRSLKMKKRDSRLLYQPHVLKRRDGELFAVFGTGGCPI
jgi:alpha-amylase/alpha-mannosidase (GH57 family)